MDTEAYPWQKLFNVLVLDLRRTFMSCYAPAAATNRATHSIFNSSSGPLVVIPRSYVGSLTTAAKINIALVQGIVGSPLGLVSPLWAGERAGAGQHCYVDTLTVYTPNFQLLSALAFAISGIHITPLAVLPPGWSCVFQAAAAAETMAWSVIWEEASIDDPRMSSVGIRG